MNTINGISVSAEIWQIARMKHPFNGDLRAGYAQGFAEAVKEQDARIAELTAEVARLREACRIAESQFSYLTNQHKLFDRQDRIRWESLGDIARNALKEG